VRCQARSVDDEAVVLQLGLLVGRRREVGFRDLAILALERLFSIAARGDPRD